MRPARGVDGPVGHRRRRSADHAASRARRRPVPAGGGLSRWRCSNISRTTSGTSRSRSRWRAAARSARSSTCASRSATPPAAARMPARRSSWRSGWRWRDKLIGLADEDEAHGRGFSASDKLERASLYLFAAERMQGHGHPGRGETYAKARDDLRRSTRPGQRSTASGSRSRSTAGTMPALYHPRARRRAASPVVVYCNGLDSCKELLYWSRLPEALARRGISTLCVDQPGTGEALRLQGLPVDPHSEELGVEGGRLAGTADRCRSRRASA